MAIAVYDNQDVMTQLIHFTAVNEGEIDAVANNPLYQGKYFLLPDGKVNYVSRRGIRQVPTWQPLAGLSLNALSILYDPSSVSLTSTDVQAALDELSNALDALAGSIDHAAANISSDTVTQNAATFDFANQLLTLKLATPLSAGVMSSGDKTKLNAIESGATGDQLASEVPVNPVGGITSNNVQSALEELQSEINTSSHAAVTLNPSAPTQESLNLSGQEIEANLATISSAGVMSSTDKVKLNGIEANAKDDQNAAEVSYDNTTSGLTATDTQGAIDELKTEVDAVVGNDITEQLEILAFTSCC